MLVNTAPQTPQSFLTSNDVRFPSVHQLHCLPLAGAHSAPGHHNNHTPLFISHLRTCAPALLLAACWRTSSTAHPNTTMITPLPIPRQQTAKVVSCSPTLCTSSPASLLLMTPSTAHPKTTMVTHHNPCLSNKQQRWLSFPYPPVHQLRCLPFVGEHKAQLALALRHKPADRPQLLTRCQAHHTLAHAWCDCTALEPSC